MARMARYWQNKRQLLVGRGKPLMKKFFACWLVVAIMCFGFALAGADTITDTYWGGTVQHGSATAYGDFIGNPYYNVDSMTVTRSGNSWNVAVVGSYFANHLNPAVDGGYPSLLGPGHHETDMFNNINPDRYVFRVDQAWSGGTGGYVGAATYALSSAGLNIRFNTGNVDFADAVGFHWTMQYGNNVIEGKANAVPEPGTMILLGTGLIGLAGYGRKRFRK